MGKIVGNFDENINIINQYRELNDPISEDYVVHGGVVECPYGSQRDSLNLPQGGGLAINDLPVLTVADYPQEIIRNFGTCGITGEICVPKLSAWISHNSDFQTYSSKTMNNENIVVTTDYLYCTSSAAEITLHSSGQSSNNKSRDCPANSILYNEGGPLKICNSKVDTWYRFEATTEICGAFEITACSEKEGVRVLKEEIGESFSYDTSDLQENLPDLTLHLYIKSGRKMNFVAELNANKKGIYQYFALDFKYSKTYFLKFSAAEDVPVFHRIDGAVDSTDSCPFTIWKRITPESLIAVPYLGLPAAATVYIPERVIYLNRDMVVRVWGLITWLLSEMRNPYDRSSDEIAAIIDNYFSSNENSVDYSSIVGNVTTNTTSAVLGQALGANFIGGLVLSILVSFIYEDLTDKESFADKLKHVTEIIPSEAVLFSAKHGAEIIFSQKYSNRSSGGTVLSLNGLDRKAVYDIKIWNDSDKSVKFPKYYRGEIIKVTNENDLLKSMDEIWRISQTSAI